jgi:palmitoyl-protein thioesterase
LWHLSIPAWGETLPDFFPMVSLTLAVILLGAGAFAEPEPVDIAQALLGSGVGQILKFDDDSSMSEPSGEATGTPIVMMHGMGDFAQNPMGMIPLRKLVAQKANAYVHSVEICNSPTQLSGCASQDQENGFFMTMDDQVDQFARVVRSDTNLSKGFNAVGFSQGNTLIRGYIHKYNDPPVKSFLSLHGVMMGVAGLPQCPMNVTGLGLICRSVDRLASLGAYTSFVQNHLAQVNYYRDPTDLAKYRKAAHFLPYINNEVQGQENATYTSNFEALEKLVLVMAEDDTMVHPKESEHFGYFKDGSNKELVDLQDAPWYTENWFGLKTLDEAKKIDFKSTPGNHLRFTQEFLLGLVDEYFNKQARAPIVV